MHPDEMISAPDYRTLAPASLLESKVSGLLPGSVSYPGLIYADIPGWRPLRLDLHIPDGPGPHPVVAYVHGGSFLVGIPAMGHWHSLPSRGIAVASLSYRFLGEATFPEPIEDVRAGLRWIVDHGQKFGLDSSRIALWGSSAGAYLAAMTAVLGQSDFGRRVGESKAQVNLSAIVSHYGVSDPDQLIEDAIDSGADGTLSLAAIMGQFFHGTSRRTSVLSCVTASETVPPFLIMHGDSDHRVGLQQSVRLHEGMRLRGVGSELVVVPGADHGGHEFAQPEVVDKVIAFLRSSWL